MNATDIFLRARDLHIELREDYEAACARFEWPRFAEMAERSSRVANFLARAGLGRGDRLLLMAGGTALQLVPLARPRPFAA